MKLIRKGLITQQEAQVLLDAIRERGELVFPLNPGEVVAAKAMLQKAQAQAGTY